MESLKAINHLRIDQPEPINHGEPVRPFAIELFLKVLARQTAKGIDSYGDELHAHNGRDPLMDAFAEQVDSLMYLAQAIMEREHGG